MTTRFELNKEYTVNFKNGKVAGTLVFTSFENFKNIGIGVNKCFAGYAKLNGKTVNVHIVGEELNTAWLVNGNSRYSFIKA